MIINPSKLRKHWTEHFSNILNRPSAVNHTAFSQIPLSSLEFELDVLSSMVEIRKAILKANTDRASRKDGILVEIYKAAGFNAHETYHDFLQSIWEVLKMMDDFWVILLVSLYNNKWNKLWKLHEILTRFPSPERSWCESSSTDSSQFPNGNSQGRTVSSNQAGP